MSLNNAVKNLVVDPAFKELLLKHGIVFKRMAGGTIRTTEASTIKFDVILAGEQAAIATKARLQRELDFKMYCHTDGLKPEHLHLTVRMGGKEFEIIGFNTAKRTKTVMLSHQGNEGWMGTGEQVVNALKAQGKF
jgi:hypothetical protein